MTDQVQGQNPNQDPNVNDPNNLGWRAALPDEYKAHDFVKTFTKPGDFVKSALEIKTERDGLKDKLGNAIFKPGKDAKPEDVSAYRKAMGVPEKPEEYEFPKGEGVEHDEKMTSWARGVFHQAGLNKEQAGVISQAWDGFIRGIVKAEEEADKATRTETEKALKTKWGADFNKNVEFVKRGFKQFANAEFDAFTADAGIGYHPVLMEFILNVGKAIGEDWSPKGTGGGGGTTTPGLKYNMPSFG